MQGFQTVHMYIFIPNFGIFEMAKECDILIYVITIEVYFMFICFILLQFDVFCGNLYIFPILLYYIEKSGSPGSRIHIANVDCSSLVGPVGLFL
jgi:hypothetical protein